MKKKTKKPKVSKLAKKINDCTSKLWQNKATKLWSDIIKNSRGRVCEVCGNTTSKLDVHHLISKEQHSSMRYDLQNGIVLCAMSCHKHLFHRDALLAAKWMMENKPEQYNYLITAAQFSTHQPIRKQDHKAAYEKLKGEQNDQDPT